MARDDWNSFPPSLPKLPPPEHGVRVKDIGATWWGEHWVRALERLGPAYRGRLARGRSYARGGRVHDLAVVNGVVTASVTGTDLYSVRLSLKPLGDRVWEEAIRAMAAKARFAAQLLAGEMPRGIEQAFVAARASLFPVRAADLRTKCSCPDSANPCKHIAAVHYVLADAFDRDPFLLFELRGATKDTVLSALRALRAAEHDAASGERTPGPDVARTPPRRRGVELEATSADAYDAFRGPVDTLRFRIAESARGGAMLRYLGPPPGWSLASEFPDLVQPMITEAARAARDIALANEPTSSTSSAGAAPPDSPRPSRP
jgi:uncharacterized Zn finger protein